MRSNNFVQTPPLHAVADRVGDADVIDTIDGNVKDIGWHRQDAFRSVRKPLTRANRDSYKFRTRHAIDSHSTCLEKRFRNPQDDLVRISLRSISL